MRAKSWLLKKPLKIPTTWLTQMGNKAMLKILYLAGPVAPRSRCCPHATALQPKSCIDPVPQTLSSWSIRCSQLTAES